MHKSLLAFLIPFFCISLYAEKFIQVVDCKGTIRYRDPSVSNVKTLKIGDLILSKSKVKIDKGGFLKLKTPKNDILTFNDKSYFKFIDAEYEQNKSTFQIDLFKGKLNCDVTKLKTNSKFTIKTPSAIVKIQGTIVDFDVNSDSSTITLTEGSATVENTNTKGSQQTLQPGQTVTVDNEGEMSVQNTTNTEQNNQSNTDTPDDSSDSTSSTIDSTTTNTESGSTSGDESNDIQSVVQQQQDDKEVEKLINLKLRINDKD